MLIKYYFLYVLEERRRCNNMYWVFIMEKVLLQSDRKLNPSLSLGCMLTQTPEKALSTKMSDGSGVSKEIEKEVFSTTWIVVQPGASWLRAIGLLRLPFSQRDYQSTIHAHVPNNQTSGSWNIFLKVAWQTKQARPWLLFLALSLSNFERIWSLQHHGHWHFII